MNDIVKALLPWLGTALGGPLGGIAAGFIGDKLGLEDKTVDTVKAVLSGMSPEKLQELQVADSEFRIKMVGLGYAHIEALEKFNVEALESVNATMRSEAASEHWPTYTWRPYNGFLFGTTIFGCYFVLPLLKLPVPVVPEFVWVAWGAILGVASYFRGKAQAYPNIPTNNKG